MTTKVKSNIKEEILTLAKSLEAHIELDKKTGIGKESAELYKTNLPEDISMEMVSKVSDYNTNFIAAGALAFGRMSVEAMHKNKDLKETSVEIPMGTRDNVTFSVDRMKEYTNHLGGGDKTKKFGVITASYEVKSGKNGGQLKAARQEIAALALEQLK